MHLQRKYPWSQRTDGTFLRVLQTCRIWAKFCFWLFGFIVCYSYSLFETNGLGKIFVCVVWPMILTSLPNSRLFELHAVDWKVWKQIVWYISPPPHPRLLKLQMPCKRDFVYIYYIILKFIFCSMSTPMSTPIQRKWTWELRLSRLMM